CQLPEVEAAGVPLARLLAVGPDERPDLGLEGSARLLGVALEIDPAALEQPVGGDPGHERPEPRVEVDVAAERERPLALDPPARTIARFMPPPAARRARRRGRRSPRPSGRARSHDR